MCVTDRSYKFVSPQVPVHFARGHERQTYQPKGQLDNSIGPVGSILEGRLLAAYTKEHIVCSDIGLAARSSAIWIGRLSVGNVTAGVDIGEGIVVDLEGCLDLDVSVLGDNMGGEVPHDTGGGFLASAVDLNWSVDRSHGLVAMHLRKDRIQ